MMMKRTNSLVIRATSPHLQIITLDEFILRGSVPMAWCMGITATTTNNNNNSTMKIKQQKFQWKNYLMFQVEYVVIHTQRATELCPLLHMTRVKFHHNQQRECILCYSSVWIFWESEVETKQNFYSKKKQPTS